MQKRKILLCLCLILAVLMTGCQEKTKLDLSMHGYVMTTDGFVVDRLELSMQGKIYHGEDVYDEIVLEIDFPESFAYMNVSSDEPEMAFRHPTHGYHTLSMFTYHKKLNALKGTMIAIDEEKGWAILLWTQDPQQILVASTDADTDPTQILAYFQDFINAYPN